MITVSLSRFKLTDAILVAFGIVRSTCSFALSILFIGEGGFRQIPITFNEIIQTTVAFRNIDEETKLVGITGNT